MKRPSVRLKPKDAFTFLSVAAAVLALLAVWRFSPVLAGALLLCSVVLDFLDGWVARKTSGPTILGGQLDSLADVVAFGAIPALIAIALSGAWWTVLIAIIFICAGAYRLARFNIAPLKGAFVGMPITVNGVVVGLLLILLPLRAVAATLPWWLLLSSVLMVGTFRVPKP